MDESRSRKTEEGKGLKTNLMEMRGDFSIIENARRLKQSLMRQTKETTKTVAKKDPKRTSRVIDVEYYRGLYNFCWGQLVCLCGQLIVC